MQPATHDVTLITDKKIMSQAFENAYFKASIRFVWKHKDIEEYIPVINIAIQATYDNIKSERYDIGENDIESMGILDGNERKVGFALYIKNKKIKYMGSIYSMFKDEFKAIAQGYHEFFGIKYPPPRLDSFIEFYRNIHQHNGVSDEELIDYWNQVQSLKRKITNFTTLANKSLNRGRRVSPKIRFEVLKRDNFRCRLCGRTSDDTKLHVDHIIPVVKGGKNNIDYLITLCIDCNLGKGISDLFK